MQRGLEGRRIALAGASTSDQAKPLEDAIVRELERAGARIHRLAEADSEEDWHAGRYAALVLLGAARSPAIDKRITQLVREFLVSDKPLAAHGSAVSALLEAGGVQGRVVCATGALRSDMELAGATCVDEPIHIDGTLITAGEGTSGDDFARRVVAAFSENLEEQAVDEMSELSFPASDPPAVTPATVGHLRPDSDRA